MTFENDDGGVMEWLKGEREQDTNKAAPDPAESSTAGSSVGSGEQSTGVKSDPTDNPEAEVEGRLCKWPDGCTNRLPIDAHNARRYCDEHLPLVKRGKRGKGGTPEPPPPLPPLPPLSTAELKRVQQNAQKFMEMAAVVVYITAKGDPIREADSADLQRGAGPWSTSVAVLAEHEPWLRKILAGGQTSERVAAWTMFTVITVTVALPILIRHKVLPEELEAVAKMAQAQSGAVAAA